MTEYNFVNGTNLVPTNCEPTAPSPSDVNEFHRYSRALAILADVKQLLICVQIDASISVYSSVEL